MKRRTYLGSLSTTLAAASGGCLTNLSTALNSMDTEFTVCGRATTQKCEETDINTNIAKLEGVYKENSDKSEAISVNQTEEKGISITGRTSGIGDPNCRETKLGSVKHDGSVLTIVVKNKDNPPLMGSCYETIELNYYQLNVSDVNPSVSKVRVRHYDGQDLQFDVSVAVN